MLASFAMEQIKNGWVLYLTYHGKKPDETWFCSTPEKGLKRIQRILNGTGTKDSTKDD